MLCDGVKEGRLLKVGETILYDATSTFCDVILSLPPCPLYSFGSYPLKSFFFS